MIPHLPFGLDVSLSPGAGPSRDPRSLIVTSVFRCEEDCEMADDVLTVLPSLPHTLSPHLPPLTADLCPQV